MKSYLENKLNSLHTGNILGVRGITVLIRDDIEYELDVQELKDVLDNCFKTGSSTSN